MTAKSNAREGDGVAGLPPLPESKVLGTRPRDSINTDPFIYGFTAEQMHAYALAALQAQQGAEPVAWFPILGTPFAIHRELLNEEQAKRNHYQTLDQLAERGGLSPSEAHAIWRRRPWESVKQVQVFADFIAATGAPR